MLSRTCGCETRGEDERRRLRLIGKEGGAAGLQGGGSSREGAREVGAGDQSTEAKSVRVGLGA